MKKLIVLAVASIFATTANAAEMKWSGSAGWRYNQTKNDDNRNSTDANNRSTSEQTTKSHAMRANLGATGGWENIEWGFGVRTNGTANSDFVNANQATDFGIGIEQAWFRYLKDFGSMDLSLTIGRQKNVLAYDSISQNLFDNDVRFDGFGWQFKFGMFGLNAAQYILGAKQQGTSGQASTYSKTPATEATAASNSKFEYLLAIQPHMMWKFTDEIETFFAVGYYLWSTDAYQNLSNGGVTDYNAGTTNTAVNPAQFNVHNPKQWHFLNTWTLPYNLTFHGELVLNKEYKYTSQNVAGYTGTVFPEAGKSAWNLGLAYGALKKAQDFTVGYSYGSKGLAAVVGNFTNNLFLPDNKGHTINAGYAIADNFHLGAKAMFLKEKEMLNANTGVALTNGQEMETTYWELTTGVLF